MEQTVAHPAGVPGTTDATPAPAMARKAPLVSATVPGGMATDVDGSGQQQPWKVALAEAEKLAGTQQAPLAAAAPGARPMPPPEAAALASVAPAAGAGPGAQQAPGEEALASAAEEYERVMDRGGPTDRMVSFLVTLVTYPFMYILVSRAARGEGGGAAAAGAPLDGRRRLEDFAEGRAITDLERWTRTNAYLSWSEELLHEYARTLAALADTYVVNPTLRSVLLSSWLLSLAGVQPPASLEAIAAGLAPRAMDLLGRSDPARALRELESGVQSNVEFMKHQLERRYALARGPTLLERAEVFLGIGRRAARFFFSLLRLWSRVLHYASSLLSIVSGALSFTVVPAIVLSVLSAATQIFALSLSSVAEFVEPIVMQALDWGEAGTSQVGVVTDIGGTVGPRRLPPHTVEGLAPLLEGQIDARTPIINRPEIPKLSSHPLLVKAYDLGLVDAEGSVDSRAVRRTLEGGARGVFKTDGFFGYAPASHRRAAVVLLARALAWQRVNAVVRGGDALRFVLVAGTPGGGKSTLFSRLTKGPSPQGAAAGDGGAAGVPAAAVRPLADPQMRGTQVVVFPGLRSKDAATATLSQSLATALAGMCCCMVFVAHPAHDASDPSSLSLLALALAARRGVLLCVNGPRRAAANGAGAGAGGASAGRELAARWRAAVDALCAREGLDAGLCSVVLTELQRGAGAGAGGAPAHGAEERPGPRGRGAAGGGGLGRGAGEAEAEGEGEGVHGYRDVEDWVKREAVAFHRMV